MTVPRRPCGRWRAYLVDLALVAYRKPGYITTKRRTQLQDRRDLWPLRRVGAITESRSRAGRFTTIDLPDVRATTPFRGNDRGQIVGASGRSFGRVGDDPNRRGFLLDHGRITWLTVPGSIYTQPLCVSPRSTGSESPEWQTGSGDGLADGDGLGLSE
jgi:hypothetical protein